MKKEEIIKNSNYRKNLGNFGETKATKYLKQLGYKTLLKNFVSRQGEIDIIAKDKEEYVFIEVKSRSSGTYGKPVDAVNAEKIKHILDVSRYFIYKNKIDNKLIRFDIIEVYINKKNYFINHIKNIFS